VRLKIYRALVRAERGRARLWRAAGEGRARGVDLVASHSPPAGGGLVSQERQGTTLICRTNYPAMNKLVGYLVDECCVDAGCQGSEKAPSPFFDLVFR